MELLRVALAITVFLCAAGGSARSPNAVEVERLYEVPISGVRTVEAAPLRLKVAGNDEARERFRIQPSFPILTKGPDGAAYVWLVDRTGAPDTLIGVRAADGTIVVRQELAG